MNIGQAARASGVSAKMIRYYEQVGLLPSPQRTASGYRVYADTDVDVLRFVRRARDLGFSLEAIGELISLWRNQDRASSTVKALALGHVDILRRRIAELDDMARTLEHLAGTCAGDHRPDCPIIDELAAAPRKSRAIVQARADRRSHVR
jgi:Cu(I)-responsive transcriptional regulator